MERPLISVILPVYNNEKYLARCLDSVLAQTEKSLEILCVDDGSPDGSPEILREYEKKDPRVRILRQENAGAGAARNHGLREARGKYLSFLDSDDFFEPDMLEAALGRLLEDQADFVVFGCDQYLNDTGEFRQTGYALRKNTLPPYRPFSFREITDNVFLSFVGWAWDKLYDADFVKSRGLWFQEQRSSNDLLFVYSALVQARRITVCDRVLAHQRRNNQESLSNTREKSWACFYHALLALRQMLKEQGLYQELERDFINYALHFSLWNYNTITGEGRRRVYCNLRSAWFRDLGVEGKSPFYFTNMKEYRQYLKDFVFAAPLT